MHHQVPAADLRGVDAGLLGDEADQIALADLAQAPDRRHVALLVQLEPVRVDPAVEVDGQLRHAQQRPVDVDQAVRAVPQGDPAGQAEVAVEPGVEQRAAVDLDGHLPPALGAGVRQRLDAQVGGESVWAPTILNGVAALASSGTNQAMIAPPRRTYLPPAEASQASVSATWRKPAFSSRSAASATAWYGEGLAARKVIRSSVWPRSKRCAELMASG
ncbi:hypothetical protein GCM10020000_41330 [Streptomyces olivoverticillatus]